MAQAHTARLLSQGLALLFWFKNYIWGDSVRTGDADSNDGSRLLFRQWLPFGKSKIRQLFSETGFPTVSAVLKPWLGLRQHETLLLFKRPCFENKRQRADSCPSLKTQFNNMGKKKKSSTLWIFLLSYQLDTKPSFCFTFSLSVLSIFCVCHWYVFV